MCDITSAVLYGARENDCKPPGIVYEVYPVWRCWRKIVGAVLFTDTMINWISPDGAVYSSICARYHAITAWLINGVIITITTTPNDNYYYYYHNDMCFAHSFTSRRTPTRTLRIIRARVCVYTGCTASIVPESRRRFNNYHKHAFNARSNSTRDVQNVAHANTLLGAPTVLLSGRISILLYHPVSSCIIIV